MSLTTKLQTMVALGPRSLSRVGFYRLLVRSGLHPVQRLPNVEPPQPPYFFAAAREGNLPPVDQRWKDSVVRFDWMIEPLPTTGIPDWSANPLGSEGCTHETRPWWTISDFGSGDIKGLWELSRFGWVLPLAQAAAKGEPGADIRLNKWISNWATTNPPYVGANWKCGQEASIRVMHLAAAAIVLNEDQMPQSGLVALIAQHLSRIAPTLSYALGQNNNHGTSEAAALFIGGSLLTAAGDVRGAKWELLGRLWLEERGARLIERDGSFSQYSVTYHRVMLDSYAIAECWRRRRGAAPFSPKLLSRLAAATDWLRTIVDEGSGDAPNIGASDGARLLPLTPTSYRDFRPSLQVASTLFRGARAYGPGHWDDAAQWLSLDLPSETLSSARSQSFDDGGWHVLRRGRAIATMRYPRFRFRPSHADALHLDLTVDGMNLLRDAGTYSYNDPTAPDGDYAGTAFHNTIMFDGQEQMPRLGRFLFGSWLRARDVRTVQETSDSVLASAAYRDARGNAHSRQIELRDTELVCVDRVSGPFATAALSWRVPPGDWYLEGNRVTNGQIGIVVTVDSAGSKVPIALNLHNGSEARNYASEELVVVVQAKLEQPGTIETRIQF